MRPYVRPSPIVGSALWAEVDDYFDWMLELRPVYPDTYSYGGLSVLQYPTPYVLDDTEESLPEAQACRAMWPEAALAPLIFECGAPAYRHVFMRLRCPLCEEKFKCSAEEAVTTEATTEGMLDAMLHLATTLRGLGCKHTRNAEIMYSLYLLEHPEVCTLKGRFTYRR